MAARVDSDSSGPERRTAAQGQADSPRPGWGNGRVALVVDDEPAVRLLVSAALRRGGWSVIEAEDAGVALDKAPTRLDLLVTDYEMPSISGISLARRLRLRDGMLPVVMVSGHEDVAAEVARLGWQRTAFVGKPFGIDALISTIGTIIH